MAPTSACTAPTQRQSVRQIKDASELERLHAALRSWNMRHDACVRAALLYSTRGRECQKVVDLE